MDHAVTDRHDSMTAQLIATPVQDCIHSRIVGGLIGLAGLDLTPQQQG
jgi:hypothetical protein